MTKHKVFFKVSKHPGFLTPWFWQAWLQSETPGAPGMPMFHAEVLEERYGYSLTKRAAKRRAKRKTAQLTDAAAWLDGS